MKKDLTLPQVVGPPPSGVLHEEGLHQEDLLLPCQESYALPQVERQSSEVLHEEDSTVDILSSFVKSPMHYSKGLPSGEETILCKIPSCSYMYSRREANKPI